MGQTLQPYVYRLNADQAVTNSIAPVTIGLVTNLFSVSIPINQRIAWKMWGLFTLGATGGFRFLVNAPAGIGDYNLTAQVVDLTTPATFNFGIFAEADITNASAVAATYKLNAEGSIEGGLTAGVITWQFAQNNATGNPITLKAGLMLEIERFSLDQ